MRQRGPKNRYPNRPTQRFRSQPRCLVTGRGDVPRLKMVIRLPEMSLRSDHQRLPQAA
jgi:hypothetical protein